MSQLDLEGLRRLAEAATPGLRRLQTTDFCGADGATVKIGGACFGEWADDDDADPKFIAACDPQTVLRLIAIAEAAGKMVDDLAAHRCVDPGECRVHDAVTAYGAARGGE